MSSTPTKLTIKKPTSAPAHVQVTENHETSEAESQELSKKWQKKTPYEHIVDLPDTYIGSIIKEHSDLHVMSERLSVSSTEGSSESEPLTSTKEVIISKKIEHVPGMFKIFDEIIVNANDNKNRIDLKIAAGETGHTKMSTLKVGITKYSDELQDEKWAISVWNDGDGIDVAMHPEEKIWIPQMIFGELLTSGNYDKKEEKVTGGKNGYGAKLTNIFSKFFKVETVDKKRKLRFTQIYRNNMLVKEEPIIEKFTGTPYTCITFVPDYAKFSLEDLTTDQISLFKKRTYDMLFCSQGRLQVYFNGVALNTKDNTAYMRLYLAGLKPDADEEETPLAYTCPHPRWQIGACMSPNFTFQQVSFVNGINTSRGGRHVDYVVKLITGKMVAYIKKHNKVDVKESFIKDNLMVFVNSIIVNPSFDSQTKETLTTNMRDFGSKIDELPETFIEALAKSGIIDRALALNQFQESQVLKKTDGKKTGRVTDIPKLDDAEFAGHKDFKKSGQCTLILTEGDSAKTLAVAGISVIPNGHEYYGIFPLRGKLVNTRDKADSAIANNVEITSIKRILGLQEGEVYEDTKKLRYGRIMIMTDADADGSHIKGLVMNYIASSFPSLLKIDGFITTLLTPIVKVWKGSNKDNAISFYSLTKFEEWLEANNGGKGFNIKYYKGLGTSNTLEGKEYFRDFKLVTYHWTDTCAEALDKAFSKARADDRKLWLKGFEGQILDLGQQRVSFTDFIDKDLIHFSMASVARAVPNLMDGMKPSIRKIIYGCFKRNLTSEIKVAQLTGYISEHCAYHHGEASLNGAIIGMAQDFVGANNINLLAPVGQFGSRLAGGSDYAAPRYIFTHLTPLASTIFKKVDENLYTYENDDGQQVEPTFYAPIIPMLFVNGTNGIGTGWSTELPQFNPVDIVSVLRARIDGKPTSSLAPWYRGFKGVIEPTNKKNSWLTRGVFKVLDSKTVQITELPIGEWTSNFKERLDELMGMISVNKDDAKAAPKATKSSPKNTKSLASNLTGSKRGKSAAASTASAASGLDEEVDLDAEKVLIKDYKNLCSESTVKFVLTFEPRILSYLINNSDKDGITLLEKKLHLTSKLSFNSKLNFFGPDGKLLNLTSIDQIMDYYFTERLSLYVKRKAFLESDMKRRLVILSAKARFILDIIEKRIVVNNKPKAEIIEQLRKLKYPVMIDKELFDLDTLAKGPDGMRQEGDYNYLISMPIYSLTKEKVEELVQERDELDKELAVLLARTPGDLWKSDLDEFEVEYAKFMKDYYRSQGLDPKEYKQTAGSSGSGKLNLSAMFSPTR